MEPFTRIYFDTNILIAANWPQPSAALERILSLAHVLKVGVFVPKAVEDELDQHWNRLFDEKYAKAKKTIADLKRHASETDVNLDDVVVMKKDAGLAAYNARTKNLKKEWEIGTAPLTLRATDELLRMAICAVPPFQEKDVGFQDAIIYLSVVDHLAKEPRQVGAFISQDRIFSDTRISEHAKAAGVSIQVFTNIEDVYKVLASRLEVVIKKAWDTDKLRAQVALMQKLSDIQKFVSEHLEISEDALGFGRSILAMRNIEVQGVRNVQTPFPLDRKENEPVRISFEIEMTVTLKVERPYVPQLTSRLKLGQEAPQLETITLGEILTLPSEEERVFPWLAEAEATAASDDKEYEDIHLSSVRSKGQNATLMIERALASGAIQMDRDLV